MTASRRAQAVVIGGSQGSFDALARILPQLPAGYPVPVVIVVHLYRHGPGSLADAVAGWTRLPVASVEDKDAIQAGRIYVCPANYHTLIEDDHTFSLSTDAPVQYARPSIDVLFESAAHAYRAGVAAVLLSGASRDGADGLRVVAEQGGWAVCQDPATAQEPMMPQAGRRTVPDAWLGSPEVIGHELAGLTP